MDKHKYTARWVNVFRKYRNGVEHSKETKTQTKNSLFSNLKNTSSTVLQFCMKVDNNVIDKSVTWLHFYYFSRYNFNLQILTL